MLVYFVLSRTGAPWWLSKSSGEAGDGSITWELVRNACSQTPRPKLPESGTLGQRAALFFFFFFLINLFFQPSVLKCTIQLILRLRQV